MSSVVALLRTLKFSNSIFLVLSCRYKVLQESCLLQPSLRFLHSSWLSVIVSCLPYLGKSLKNVVMVVVQQLCANIRSLANEER